MSLVSIEHNFVRAHRASGTRLKRGRCSCSFEVRKALLIVSKQCCHNYNAFLIHGNAGKYLGCDAAGGYLLGSDASVNLLHVCRERLPKVMDNTTL